ncbi:putative lipoprotein [Treponema primitia ZAS-2]|uniref:Putative lipoprotein n=1 Tax=Treponema primitia (strain ATCC BAA-887 / DSM 12427 / ZAS-2) TaxID=545694 RepID=F5YIG5_TREPZ|nr:hypothetical protein [Treponema primitia]AEF83648.1 putative lipoprotein [Treponema primitia ZAS-2]
MYFKTLSEKLRILILLLPVLASCSYKEPAAIPFYGISDVPGSAQEFYALSKESVSGLISPDKPKNLSYSLAVPAAIGGNSSLELEYHFAGLGEGGMVPTGNPVSYQLVLELNGNAAWELPRDASFLGIETRPRRIRYSVPLPAEPLRTLGLRLEKTGTSGIDVQFQLDSLGIIKRWYGFTLEQDKSGPPVLKATPFVFSRDNALVIDIPVAFRFAGAIALQAAFGDVPAGEKVFVQAGPVRYEWSVRPREITLPPGAFPLETFPLGISGAPLSLVLDAAPVRPFPLEPAPADPGLILGINQEAWRDRRFEVFRWERFPSILIFDTADYAIQDRLLKRLAFFTEKAGFRGRLAPDEEIAELHGWNAHDYRAEDLAHFFEAARAQNFPLLSEERELGAILEAAGILVRTGAGAYAAGQGAIISISRESADYLRSMFMAHEGFHGIFFIDEEFRAFSSRRWETLPRLAKNFILSYFDYQHYDLKDQYLMVNEFMAHILQQPSSRAGVYFGETLAGRIDESSWRRTVLPPKDEAAGNWPELAAAFTAEANAFSSYVNRRWNLAAGRVWQVSVRKAP